MRLFARQDAQSIEDLRHASQVCVIAHLLGITGPVKQEVSVPTDRRYLQTSAQRSIML